MRLKLHFSWREKTGKITKFIESKVFQKIRKFKHKKKNVLKFCEIYISILIFKIIFHC